MNRKNFINAQELFSYAQGVLEKSIEKSLKGKEFCDIALLGGNTAKEFFPYIKKIDFELLKKVRWFFSDERCVLLDSPDSNAGQAQRLLLDPLGINQDQFFPPYNQEKDAQKAALAYEQVLKNLLVKNEKQIPVFDLIFLGMGADGHFASLFPQSELVKNFNKNPRLIEVYKSFKINHTRLTMMPRLIEAAKEIMLLAVGNEKVRIINQVELGEDEKDFKYPVKILTAQDNITFLCV